MFLQIANTIAIPFFLARRFFTDYKWNQVPEVQLEYKKDSKTLSWQPAPQASIYKVIISYSKQESSSFFKDWFGAENEATHYTNQTTLEIEIPDNSTYRVYHQDLIVAVDANISTAIAQGGAGSIDLLQGPTQSGVGLVTGIHVHSVSAIASSTINTHHIPLVRNSLIGGTTNNATQQNGLSVACQGNFVELKAAQTSPIGKQSFQLICQYKVAGMLWTVPCSTILEVNVQKE